MPNDSVFDPSNRPVFNQSVNIYTNPGITAPPENNAEFSGRGGT